MTPKPTSGPLAERWRPMLAAALLIASGAILGACSATTIADHMPTAVGGLPEGSPERPAEQHSYPPVHDRPNERSSSTLTAAEQKRLEEDLIAARNRLGTSGAAAKPSAGSTRNP